MQPSRASLLLSPLCSTYQDFLSPFFARNAYPYWVAADSHLSAGALNRSAIAGPTQVRHCVVHWRILSRSLHSPRGRRCSFHMSAPSLRQQAVADLRRGFLYRRWPNPPPTHCRSRPRSSCRRSPHHVCSACRPRSAKSCSRCYQ